MANRLTVTDKWRDNWFIELSKNAKLLFLYLCDNCDIAGFIEISKKIWSFETDITITEIDKALLELSDKIQTSTDRKQLFIINFIKIQKNLPLNITNNVHKSIIKRLEDNIQLFDLQDFIKINTAPNKPLSRGYSNSYIYSNNNNNNNNNNNKDNNININKEKFNFKKELINYGFEENYVNEWLEIRKQKKAVNTQTAFKRFISEIEKTKHDKNKIIKLIVEKSWAGFENKWLNDKNEEKFVMIKSKNNE